MARLEPKQLGTKVLIATISLLAGAAVMAILETGQPLRLYFIVASVIGGVCIGLPLVLSPASRILSDLAWPLVFVAGLCLGPVALMGMFIITALVQALLGFGLGTFPLSGVFTGTASLWPISSLVSVVAMAVYSALIRRWPSASRRDDSRRG